MNRTDALPYVSFIVNDALSIHPVGDVPTNARLVGWQCGFEPLFVAVVSYLGVRLVVEEAEEIAADALYERGWFGDEVPDADYVI